MYDINGKILGVTGSTTRNGGSKYNISFSDGKTYSTFDQAAASKANGLLNQDVTMRVEQKPSRDGTRMFDNMIDVALVGQLGQSPQGVQIGGGIPMTVGGGIPMNNPIPMVSGGGGGMSNEDKQRISRFAAAGTAFEFIGSIYAGGGPESLAEAVKNARALTAELVRYGYTGDYSLGGQQVAQPVPTTPQEVAQQVPGVQVGAEGIDNSHPVDDIPWN